MDYMQLAKNNYTDEELVALLKRKDINAYCLLYDNYSTTLFGLISRTVDETEIAEDILQDVFVKIWKNIENYEASKGSLITWMLNIARNTVINYSQPQHFELQDKIKGIETTVDEISKKSSAPRNTDFIEVKEEVVQWQEEPLILMDMIYFSGYTQEDTAKELNIPLGTVRTSVRTAILKLRETLK